MKDHHSKILNTEEDRGNIADNPGLDACSAFGNAPEGALAKVTQADTGWLEAAKVLGKPVPTLRYHPAIYQIRSSAKQSPP